MAKLTKSRARKPLSEGGVSFAGNVSNGTYSYTAYIYEDDDAEIKTAFRLEMNSVEALRFVDLIVGMETHNAFEGNFYNVDRRSLNQKLRALADKLEAEAL
jgi:hypothetical protein